MMVLYTNEESDINKQTNKTKHKTQISYLSITRRHQTKFERKKINKKRERERERERERKRERERDQ
jgi:hypothetical protein